MLRFAASSRVALVCRYLLACVVLLVCSLAIARAMIYEAFDIPTGSMAPSLRGRHRVCVCPGCGSDVVVGRHRADADGAGEARFYRKAFCSECGYFPLPVVDFPEVAGDQVIVNRAAYLVRPPARWEVAVFRLLGTFYIKRLLGLPGEEVCIKDGDVYINGRLCRKTLDEVRKLRVLLKKGMDFDSAKCEPIRDEYAYNAGVQADSECVHDFSLETQVAPTSGRGTLSLRLCDGHEWIEVLLPVGQTKAIEAFAWPTSQPGATRQLGATRLPLGLQPGQSYRVELAFVERRVSLAIDGALLLQLDLPDVEQRAGVALPVQVYVNDAQATLRDFRLYRDVHYSQQGKNAVGGKSVHLGVDQYFVLGDNSPCSQDSRSWAEPIEHANLIGPVTRVINTSPGVR